MPIMAVAAEVVTQHDIFCYPLVVWFSDPSALPTTLNVDLKAVNMPTDKGSYYDVIAYSMRDGIYKLKSTLKSSSKYTPNEVVRIPQNIIQLFHSNCDNCYIAYCFYKEKRGHCEMGKDALYNVIIFKYSKEITSSDCIAGRYEPTLDLKNNYKNFDPAHLAHRLPYYPRDQNTLELEVPETSSQHYDQKTNENRLTLWLNYSHDSKTLFCAQDCRLVVEHAGGGRSVTRYGELAASGNITLKLQEEVEQAAPKVSISSKEDSQTDTPKLCLHDTGSGGFDSKVNITCSVFGQKFDLLSLYQDTENGHELQKIIQHLNDEEGDIILTLIKTLVNSDKGSRIYCVKHKPDDFSYKRKSNVETLNDPNHKYISQDPARVFVEPAAGTAWFSRDKPLSLVCRGTKVLDDRNLTWYIRDQNTLELEVPEPSSQHYDQKINENRLTLWLNDTHDSKTLFCAQDCRLVVEHAGGGRSVTRYGELAASGNITLKLQEEVEQATPKGSTSSEEDSQTGGDSASGLGLALVYGLVVGIAFLLIVVAVVARRLCRRKRKGGGPEENQCRTAAELTYAVLDLPQSGGAPANGHDNTSPYVQIVGVYNPRK